MSDHFQTSGHEFRRHLAVPPKCGVLKWRGLHAGFPSINQQAVPHRWHCKPQQANTWKRPTNLCGFKGTLFTLLKRDTTPKSAFSVEPKEVPLSNSFLLQTGRPMGQRRWPSTSRRLRGPAKAKASEGSRAVFAPPGVGLCAGRVEDFPSISKQQINKKTAALWFSLAPHLREP